MHRELSTRDALVQQLEGKLRMVQEQVDTLQAENAAFSREQSISPPRRSSITIHTITSSGQAADAGPGGAAGMGGSLRSSLVSHKEGPGAAARVEAASNGSSSGTRAAGQGAMQSQAVLGPASAGGIGVGRGNGGELSLRSSMVASSSQPSTAVTVAVASNGGTRATASSSMRQASLGPIRTSPATRASVPGSLRRSLGPDSSGVRSRDSMGIATELGQWGREAAISSSGRGPGLTDRGVAGRSSVAAGRVGSHDMPQEAAGTLCQYNIARPSMQEQQQQINIGKYKRSSSVPRSSESPALLKLKEQQSMQRWQRQQQLQLGGSPGVISAMYRSEPEDWHTVPVGSSSGTGAVMQSRESVVGSRGLTAAARLSRGPGSPSKAEMERWSLDS